MLPQADVPVVREEEPVFDALTELSGGSVHRALVLDDGHLRGFISISDIARFMSSGPPARPARRP